MNEKHLTERERHLLLFALQVGHAKLGEGLAIAYGAQTETQGIHEAQNILEHLEAVIQSGIPIITKI